VSAILFDWVLDADSLASASEAPSNVWAYGIIMDEAGTTEIGISPGSILLLATIESALTVLRDMRAPAGPFTLELIGDSADVRAQIERSCNVTLSYRTTEWTCSASELLREFCRASLRAIEQVPGADGRLRDALLAVRVKSEEGCAGRSGRKRSA